ncbi:structural molecule [Branchiostoma belcheri]|nr:structural molecule [Branchiostoma belcheri]
MNSRQELNTLNTRLTGYINKVKSLEARNAELEMLIAEAAQAHKMAGGAASAPFSIDDSELKAKKKEIQELANQVSYLESQKSTLLAEIDNLRRQLEALLSRRSELESDISGAKGELDAALGALDGLQDEVAAAEDEMSNAAQGPAQATTIEEQIDVVQVERLRADLNDSLQALRGEFEQLASQGIADVEGDWEAKLRELQAEIERLKALLEELRMQVSQLRAELSAILSEAEQINATNISLERDIKTKREEIRKRLEEYRITIADLNGEAQRIDGEIQSVVAQYNDLLNKKLALEKEVFDYESLVGSENQR